MNFAGICWRHICTGGYNPSYAFLSCKSCASFVFVQHGYNPNSYQVWSPYETEGDNGEWQDIRLPSLPLQKRFYKNRPKRPELITHGPEWRYLIPSLPHTPAPHERETEKPCCVFSPEQAAALIRNGLVRKKENWAFVKYPPHHLVVETAYICVLLLIELNEVVE